MPSKPFDRQYGQALLDFIQGGGYPDSEIISAEVPSTAIPGILKQFKQAREDVKASIKATSKNCAQDIDGWISQAKQLQSDIEESQQMARHIVEKCSDGEHLRGQVQDAAAKVGLLEEEVDFTEHLIRVYESVGRLCWRLDTVQEALQQEDLIRAAKELVQGEGEVESLGTGPNARAKAIIQARFGSLRDDITANLLGYWNAMIQVSMTPGTLSIKHQTLRLSPISLDSTAEALLTLNLLDDTISEFCRKVESAILQPLLQSQHGGNTWLLDPDDRCLNLANLRREKSVEELFTDVSRTIQYLSTNLPLSIASRIPGFLGPSLAPMITSSWLVTAVPTDLDGIEAFQNIVESVLLFANTLEGYKWPGKATLDAWTQEIPELWLGKRRELTLHKVRKLLASGPRDVQTVEREETQILSRKEDMFTSTEADDSWNAEWSDDEEVDRSEAVRAANADEKTAEEYVSAWGLGDDTNEDDKDSTHQKTHNDNEDADAWGWGNEEEYGDKPLSPKEVQASSQRVRSNGISEAAHTAERQITLKETYNISALPKELFDHITRALTDAEALGMPMYHNLPIASASTGLFALPGLILTMYRASAPACYSNNPSGNMFLYNDSLWLAERLQQRGQEYVDARADFFSDITALSAFGKRAYSREMESQRTILSDLLDGAQGFSNCTVSPFAQECELAISSTIDRIREVYQRWQPVLSHSALLQSLGSLLSTVVNKIIVDIEDISDISEPESQRLTALCNRVATLEDVFLPQCLGKPHETSKSTQASVPLTAVYTPGWLKFQYLANILESSLVDIKYLWEEGELRLEFEVEELVDLIEALFADSEHRRRAIGDIRRTSSTN